MNIVKTCAIVFWDDRACNHTGLSYVSLMYAVNQILTFIIYAQHDFMTTIAISIVGFIKINLPLVRFS